MGEKKFILPVEYTIREANGATSYHSFFVRGFVWECLLASPSLNYHTERNLLLMGTVCKKPQIYNELYNVVKNLCPRINVDMC